MTRKALETLATLRAENEALRAENESLKGQIDMLHETIFKKEDLMRKIFSQKQAYYDELVAAKDENEKLTREVETLRAAANGADLQETFIQATVKAVIESNIKIIREAAIKEFAHFLIDEAEGIVIYKSDLPDLVCEMLSKYPEDITSAKNEP